MQNTKMNSPILHLILDFLVIIFLTKFIPILVLSDTDRRTIFNHYVNTLEEEIKEQRREFLDQFQNLAVVVEKQNPQRWNATMTLQQFKDLIFENAPAFDLNPSALKEPDWNKLYEELVEPLKKEKRESTLKPIHSNGYFRRRKGEIFR